ncbi:MAG TPA: KEOPS complex subunit Cgi121 [Nitrososphaeraceae archaeon]|nr:KEOPS complex subunit Cgi121 [Nitrososphaeraceae archaeon]
MGTTSILIVGTKAIEAKDIGEVVDDLRGVSARVSVQAIDANVVYGIEHLLEVMKVSLESKKRRIMIAKNPETDLLLRLSYINQISAGLKYGGIKNGVNCCFDIFAEGKNGLLKVHERIKKSFDIDDSVLRPNEEKRAMISSKIGIKDNSTLLNADDDTIFMRFICEKSCLITL